MRSIPFESEWVFLSARTSLLYIYAVFKPFVSFLQISKKAGAGKRSKKDFILPLFSFYFTSSFLLCFKEKRISSDLWGAIRRNNKLESPRVAEREGAQGLPTLLRHFPRHSLALAASNQIHRHYYSATSSASPNQSMLVSPTMHCPA